MKTKTLTLRIEPSTNAYLEKLVKAINKGTAFEVSKTWVVMELMKFGKEGFEKKYGVGKKSAKKAG